jgi:hypothetical protein
VNAAVQLTLAAQRAALCSQLQAQRHLIAQQLGIEPGSRGAYPQSKTMRLLTQHPALILSTLGGLVRLFRRR